MRTAMKTEEQSVSLNGHTIHYPMRTGFFAFLSLNLCFSLVATGQEQVAGCIHAAACNFNPAATISDGSCSYPGCDVPSACNFDPEALCSDSDLCAFEANCASNGNPGSAVEVVAQSLGNCLSYNGTLNGAGPTGSSGIADVWYKLEAASGGICVLLETTGFDAQLQVFDGMFNELASKNVQSGIGNEVLNFPGVAGVGTFFVAVSAVDAIADGTFEVCFQKLAASSCDSGYGPHNLMSDYKADWVGAHKYRFKFHRQGGTQVYEAYSSGGGSLTTLELEEVPDLQPGTVYAVEVYAEYLLDDGFGGNEWVVVPPVSVCEMEISDPAPLTMHESENCKNAGQQLLGNYIHTSHYLPNVQHYKWKFVRQDEAEDPVIHETDANNRQIRLSDVAGLKRGAEYTVQVRPIYAIHFEPYGATKCLRISGYEFRDEETPVELDVKTAAVSELSEGPAISVYPNPLSTGALHVRCSGWQAEAGTLVITDATGRVYWEQSIGLQKGTVQIHGLAQELAAGSYVVHCFTPNNKRIQRLIVR